MQVFVYASMYWLVELQLSSLCLIILLLLPISQAEKPPPCHKTYSVKSPLLRRLSVATPKLKAIKRQRTTQSAEAVSVIKKHQKVICLLLAVFV